MRIDEEKEGKKKAKFRPSLIENPSLNGSR